MGLFFYENKQYVDTHWIQGVNTATAGFLQASGNFYKGEVKGLKKHGYGELIYGKDKPVIHTSYDRTNGHAAINYKGNFVND